MQNTNVVLIEQRDTSPVGFVSLMILCGIVALVASYFWYIVIIAGVMFTGSILWMLFRDQQLRAHELSVRADEQNHLYLQGDERGVYGNPG